MKSPFPKNPAIAKKTPFSFQRFIIPEARGFQGKGIYLDSDMLVFSDIGELFDLPFEDAHILAVPQETSVMVLDFARLPWKIAEFVRDLDEGKLSYDGLMSCRAIAKLNYCLPKTWNWLDNAPGATPSSLSLLHYTVTDSQPWVSSGHPLGKLWLHELFEALDDGSISREALEDSIEQGFVRPSLRYQVEHRVTRKEEIPATVLKEDEPFAEYCRSVHYVLVEGFRRTTLA